MKKLSILIIIISAVGLQACGQKGPLEVERTQTQQERERSGTR